MIIIKFLIYISTIFFMPFVMIGIIKKVKAHFCGKKGAPIFQPLFDYLKLLKKEFIYPANSSFVYRLNPIIGFSAVMAAALFVPVAGTVFYSIRGAFVVAAYLLALQKFLSLIASLDVGSSFEGMGASREACFSTIVEPAFFVALGSIAALTNRLDFYGLMFIIQNSGVYGFLIIALLIVTLFIMLLIEGCRIPVDDPETHLELTMIHEVMILNYTGRNLALVTHTSMLKMFIFASLIALLAAPVNLGFKDLYIIYIGTMFLISILVGIIESITARFRMSHIFEFIFLMSIGALLILVFTINGIYGN